MIRFIKLLSGGRDSGGDVGGWRMEARVKPMVVVRVMPMVVVRVVAVVIKKKTGNLSRMSTRSKVERSVLIEKIESPVGIWSLQRNSTTWTGR